MMAKGESPFNTYCVNLLTDLRPVLLIDTACFLKTNYIRGVDLIVLPWCLHQNNSNISCFFVLKSVRQDTVSSYTRQN